MLSQADIAMRRCHNPARGTPAMSSFNGFPQPTGRNWFASITGLNAVYSA